MAYPKFFLPATSKSNLFKDKGHIEVATSADVQAINGLRLLVYKNARDFNLLAQEQILWNKSDPVLTACTNDQEIISTLQGNIFTTKEQLENFIHHSTSLRDQDFPCLYLCLAATKSEFRSSGLNSLLRMHFLNAAIKNNDIKSLVGIVFEGASRTSLMKNMGYKFVKMQHFGFEHVQPNREPIIAILERERFKSGYEYLKNECQSTLQAYPWRNQRLTLDTATAKGLCLTR